MLSKPDLDAILLPDFTPTGTAGTRLLSAHAAQGESSAQVNSGALLCFDGSVPAQALDDISNSVLFCQLAADKKFDRKTTPQDWSAYLLSVLTTVGWTMQSTSQTSETARGTVDWGALVTARMSRAASRLAKEGIAACDDLPATANAIRIWNAAVLSPASNLFLIAAAPPAGSSVALSLCLCSFQPAAPTTGFLAWDLQYDIGLVWLDLTLNESVYARVRQTIIDKLGDRPKYLVADVQLEQLEDVA